MFFDGIDGNQNLDPKQSRPGWAHRLDGDHGEAWISPFTSVLPSTVPDVLQLPRSPASYLGVTDAFGGGMKAIGALWIDSRQRYLATGPPLGVGSWNHTVMTYDGSRLTLYVNGTAVGQITGLERAALHWHGGNHLGGHSTPVSRSASTASSMIAAIYNYALSPAQVARHYALRRSAPLTGLVLASDPEAPLPAGQTVTFTATPSGGIAAARVQVAGLHRRDRMAVARDWSTTATLEWTPAVPDRWAHVVVWARSAGDPSDLPSSPPDSPFPVS